MINYLINEADIAPTLSDFEVFCSYITYNRPTLTKTGLELGKKDCFALDALLSQPRNMSSPQFLQVSYPSINLFFRIAVEAGLFILQASKKDSFCLVPSPLLVKYQALNPFSKYLLLFQTYWAKLDFFELYFDTATKLHHFMYTKLAFEILASAPPSERIFADLNNFPVNYEAQNPLHQFFISTGLVVHHLRDFGFWNYEEAHISNLQSSTKDIYVNAITPTPLGIAMINACRKRPYELYNEKKDDQSIQMHWQDEFISPILAKLELRAPLGLAKTEPFERVFLKLFPPNSIDASAIKEILQPEIQADSNSNIYIFKVSLNKRTWRVIKLSSAHTLYHLHQAIQQAYSFNSDHLYAFFMDGKAWSSDVFWAKECEDKPFANEAVLGKLNLIIGKKFLYLFDFGDEWKFDVELVEKLHTHTPPFKPMVIESHGVGPKQY